MPQYQKQRNAWYQSFFSSFLILASSFYMLVFSSFSIGHSFLYIHMSKQSGSYLLSETTCMLAMVRNDSRVHQAELKKKKKKERKGKKMSSFPILRNCSRPFAHLFACSLACSLFRLVPDCPDVMYKRIPLCALSHTHAQHHGYDDDEGSMVLASKSHQCKKRVRKQRKKIHFFSLFFNKRQELTLYFTYIYKAKKRHEDENYKGSIRWCRKRNRE